MLFLIGCVVLCPQIPSALKRQLQGPDLPYNQSAMPKPVVKPPKTVIRGKSGNNPSDKVVDGEESYVVTGTIYRDRIHSPGGPGAAAFANGGGPPPNGGGLLNTVLGGLMISNSCVVTLGKWCAYLKIDSVVNYVVPSADPAAVSSGGIGFSCDTDSAKDQNTSVTQVLLGEPRRFLVGKFDTEHEAKLNLEMVSAFEFLMFCR